MPKKEDGRQPKPKSIWGRLSAFVAYKGYPLNDRFILKEPEREKELAELANSTVKPGLNKRRKRKYPIKASEIGAKHEQSEQGNKGVSENQKNNKERLMEEKVKSNLDDNLEVIKKLFCLPLNKDVVIRQFIISTEPEIKAAAVFTEGISDKATINNFVLKPLMLLTSLNDEGIVKVDICTKILSRYLPSNQVSRVDNFSDVATEIIAGSTVIFLSGSTEAIAAETKGFEHRTASDPKTEQVTLGPHLAFNEVLRVNLALVRVYLKSTDLITEFLPIKNRAKSDIAIMYMHNIANPELVKEVKKRIKSIESDFMFEVGRLEKYIEDNPTSIIPQALRTERPDRVAGSLLEGRIAIFTTGSPSALIVPVSIFSFLQSAEDEYTRWPVTSWLRTVRLVSAFVSLLLPAFYIAIAIYHHEMLPTDLLLAISSAREKVPFPTVVEVLLMELAFELIREAAIRIPGAIGPTIGIVGALILGQAAVEAAIVSPLLVVIVAVTALSSFAIPNLPTSLAFRLGRFVYIVLASIFGFIGIAAGLFVQLSAAVNMSSFGVPMLAPVAPVTRYSRDLILTGLPWGYDERPDELQAQEVMRQPKYSRGWIKEFIKPKYAKEQGGRGDGDDEA